MDKVLVYYETVNKLEVIFTAPSTGYLSTIFGESRKLRLDTSIWDIFLMYVDGYAPIIIGTQDISRGEKPNWNRIPNSGVIYLVKLSEIDEAAKHIFYAETLYMLNSISEKTINTALERGGIRVTRCAKIWIDSIREYFTEGNLSFVKNTLNEASEFLKENPNSAMEIQRVLAEKGIPLFSPIQSGSKFQGFLGSTSALIEGML